MGKSGRTKPKLYIEDVIEPAIVRSQTFAKASPEAAAMWLYKKNCGFGPEDFSYGSTVCAWFKCPQGRDHIFQSPIQILSRAVRDNSPLTGCPFCRGLRPSVTNSLAARFPEIAKEWMTRKNGMGPDQVSFGSNILAWWKCSKGHEWKGDVANRTTRGAGCARCNRGAPTDLRDYPEVLQEFDHQKNKGVDPFALPVGVKVNWKCAENPSHKWVSGFYRTTKATRCPYCTNKRGSKENSLKNSHPHLAAQWDKEKNGDKKPTDITAGSSYRAFWKCKKGPDHEWDAKVIDRALYETGCPFCSYRKTSITNVITTVAPDVAKEWHIKKNGKVLPSQERSRSRTKRWWRCSRCWHEWQAEPYRRVVLGSGCPSCAKLAQINNLLEAQDKKSRKLKQQKKKEKSRR
ncbi:MAG TPA: zinc-ribbon domain-containing protein [Candidatus Obscuribacter sp.]|nr:zinc-ribbon domain-containing protein [Candidatus Obscuribacter sp.]HND08682.1 zinc-ribbon domain-containing protein [Candidatus Obscuribacter sp.]HND70127.1 zinc-ribbon domain-containing protein [Candidatus Obscuribacter sp.]HNG21927.1 zinc-ribbon domain-containing protein [Candidatus Obscuribacter sp.]HNH76834.1 zinc-ribbon domain-containing protein [Candidatus Obscuribacter sp.]